MIRISSLLGMRVVTEDGVKVGRIEEIHTDDKGVVTALILGARGWLEREGGRSSQKRIAWDRVKELNRKQIVVRGTGRG